MIAQCTLTWLNNFNRWLMADTPEERKRKNKRQSKVYQFYLNKNWADKFKKNKKESNE